MGRYTGILLCSDFDGTLSVDGKVSRENMEAIRKFTEGGGLFTVASGRYYDFLLDFFPDHDFNAPLITLNGAVFYDTQKKLICRERFMTGLTVDYIKEIFERIIGLTEVVFYTKSGFVHISKDTLDTLQTLDLSTIYKLSVRVDADMEISDKATLDIKSFTPESYEVARSWYWGIEVQNIENTKGPATRELARLVGANKLVCAGDFENDIGMLRSADVGYAVGNCIDTLRDAADRITVPAAEHAIAKIIEEL